jgi:multicomponent K+:H+ antiporter subunit E
MTWFLPFPFLSAFLLVTWLLLNQSLAIGQIVLGLLLALVGGWVTTAIELPDGRPGRFGIIVRLTFDVLADILRSNLAVGRTILGLSEPAAPGFVKIPLDLCNSYGLATLAVIITATPGTVWVMFDPGEHILTIHVLDLADESTWIRTIKQRYERQLLEIFE